MSNSDELKTLLEFELACIAGGGADVIDSDVYEIDSGENNGHWEVSISETCGKALERIEALEAERDTLAAHVDRIVRAWIFDDTGIHDKRIEHVRVPYLRWEAVNQAIMAAPNTSLARIKARWQADAMGGWLEQVRHMEGLNTHDCLESAELYAEELRRQAEGGRDD